MRKVININDGWNFCLDKDTSFEKVNLPHTWNAFDGQDGGGDYYRGKGWYKKELREEDCPKGSLHYLEINGANSSATVYVDGKEVCSHDGGYSTFRCDITDYLQKRSLLEICVDNSANESVYPQVADFTFYGGLYRDVNLITVSKKHFALSYYGTPGLKVSSSVLQDKVVVEVEVFTNNVEVGDRLTYCLFDKEGAVVKSCEVDGLTTKVSFELEKWHLWEGKKDPYLYSVKVFINDDEDEVSARVGLRSFEVDCNRGFILNGKEYPLRGVSRHQDRLNKGNAISKEDHKEDMALINELGATCIRLAHYQHDQYFYDLCDEYGLVVWAEIPYISKHLEGRRENCISQFKELIVQNYNHPSIMFWGLSNEITINNADNADLFETHQILNDLAHEMDKGRLTTVAAVSTCKTDSPYLDISDVVSYNHYFGWYGEDPSYNGKWFDEFHKKYPHRAIGLSEYGCEGLDYHSSKPLQGDYTEEYQAFYHQELILQLFSRKYLWSTFVWNMFDFGSDFRSEGGEPGQNHKGLVSFDRKYKKDSFYAYKAWLSKEPFVHICSKRYTDRVEEVTKVTVYSNLESVTLFVNGVCFQTQRNDTHFFDFYVPNVGTSFIKAIAGDCMDESVIKKVEAFNSSYQLLDNSTIINWFEITEVEGCFSINSKLSDIYKSDEAKAVVDEYIDFSAKGGHGQFDVNGDLFKITASFALRRLTPYLTKKGKLTREILLELNQRLNKIFIKK